MKKIVTLTLFLLLQLQTVLIAQEHGKVPSIAVLKDSLQRFIKEDNKRGQAQAYIMLANCYSLQNNPKQAIVFLEKGLQCSKAFNDPQYIGGFYLNIANAYQQLGDEEKCTFNQLQAIKEFEKLGDEEYIALIYHQMSVSYINSKQPEKAIEYEKKAYALFRKHNNKWGIGACLIGIGMNYHNKHQDDSALYCFKKSLEYITNENSDSLISVSVAYANMGNLHRDNKNYKEALFYYKKVYELDKRGKDVHAIINDLGNLSNTYLNLGDYQKALEFANMELDSAKKYNDLMSTMSAYWYLSTVHAKLGNYKSAYDYYKLNRTLSDSLLYVDKLKASSALMIKYETSEKEKKILALNKDNLIKGAELKTAQALNIAAITLLSLLFLILFFTWYFYKNKRKTEQLAFEKKEVSALLEGQVKERERIAADLHDRLGSMLATVKLYFNSVEENIEQLKKENKEYYSKASSLLDEACEEVRKISHDLASGVLVKLGLLPALNELKETVSKSDRLQMEVLSFGLENRLAANMEVDIYRIIQELLSNTLKHAQANKFSVQLNRNENNLNIIVEDDGIGLDTEKLKNKDGIGLKNVRERMKKMNGKLEIDSNKGKGTIFILDIPLTDSKKN